MVVLVRAGGERVVQLPDHRADGVRGAVAGNHKGKQRFGHKGTSFRQMADMRRLSVRMRS